MRGCERVECAARADCNLMHSCVFAFPAAVIASRGYPRSIDWWVFARGRGFQHMANMPAARAHAHCAAARNDAQRPAMSIDREHSPAGLATRARMAQRMKQRISAVVEERGRAGRLARSKDVETGGCKAVKRHLYVLNDTCHFRPKPELG